MEVLKGADAMRRHERFEQMLRAIMEHDRDDIPHWMTSIEIVSGVSMDDLTKEEKINNKTIARGMERARLEALALHLA